MNAEIDITGVELTTSRMLLRPWREEDLNDFYAYAKVDGVGQMAGWTPHKNLEESASILRMFIAHKKTFAIVYHGKAIGSIGIEEYDEEAYPALADLSCRELGFVLSKEFWGQGLMPEAVNAVIDWLFFEKKLDAILCCHFSWNMQSARVQEKCGFRYYASGKYQTQYGTVEDDVVNILFPEDKVIRYSELEQSADAVEILISMSSDWEEEDSCRGYTANTVSDFDGKRIFAAMQGSFLVGYLIGTLQRTTLTTSVMPSGTPCFEVDELYIRPSFRSRGIGAALFQFAETCVRSEAEYTLLTAAAKNWKAILHFYIEELGMEFWSARLFHKIQ